LRTILKKIPALAGEVQWGTKVQIGYYAQQLDDLDDRNEIIMELRGVAPSSATAGELRSFLAKFLFTGDDVYKHVRDLSGGEKGRLALAKLIYSRVNVLVLDEPTNHLDIPSREALEEALDAFEGTIVTISHDRYFLDRVATQILALNGEGLAEHYDGDYTEYHDWKAKRISGEDLLFPDKQAIGLGSAAGGQSVNNPVSSLSPAKVKSPEEKSKQPGKGKAGSAKSQSIKVIKKNRSESFTPELLEVEIAKTEQTLSEISDQMSQPEVARDKDRFKKLSDDFSQVESSLRALYEEWERVSTAQR
jgi:ATP-binding cassette subfamily F protein 3